MFWTLLGCDRIRSYFVVARIAETKTTPQLAKPGISVWGTAIMTAFELVEPSSLGEALGLLDPDDPAVRPIAGGTALMLMMKTGLYRPRRLVSLRALGRTLTIIAATPEGGLDIGAMVRLAQIERSAVVRQAAPVVGRHVLRRGPPLRGDLSPGRAASERSR